MSKEIKESVEKEMSPENMTVEQLEVLLPELKAENLRLSLRLSELFVELEGKNKRQQQALIMDAQRINEDRLGELERTYFELAGKHFIYPREYERHGWTMDPEEIKRLKDENTKK